MVVTSELLWLACYLSLQECISFAAEYFIVPGKIFSPPERCLEWTLSTYIIRVDMGYGSVSPRSGRVSGKFY